MKNILLIIPLFIFAFSCKKENDSILENAGSSCSIVNQETTDENYLMETIPYKNIVGINANFLSLDIHYPDSFVNLRPVIVYVHGGGWSVGDKAQQIQNKINFCKEEQYVLVSVNYRLSPYPYEIDNPDRIKFPSHNLDVADALKAVYDHIADYGGNPEKIAILGHSAGAHLVSLTGTNISFLENVGLSFINIKGVASIDIRAYNIPDRVTANNTESQDMFINAFGVDEDENIVASPFHNVFPYTNYPKFLIATRGSLNRIEAAEAFRQKLEDFGVTVSLVNGNPYDHEGINNAIGQEDEALISTPLRLFFEECFE